jgi:hypothetical protein
MWGKVVAKKKKAMEAALDLDDDYKGPKDHAEWKAAMAATRADYDDADCVEYDVLAKELAKMESRMKTVTTWTKKNVLDVFGECEFYMCNGGVYGECVLIPARYVGEAATPTFFYYTDAIVFEKA